MVEVDFYELLGVARTASHDEIEEAVKQQTRQWTKRASSASLDIRQEAETRLKLLRGAREALLTNPDARAAYDRALGTGVQQPTVGAGARAETADGKPDWVGTAQAALGQNDYHSAAYAAREATQVLGNSAVSWLLRSRANLGLGRVQDALYEAREAVQMEQNNAEYHFHLGNVYEQSKDWVNALKEYQVAGQLAPDIWLYQVSQGSVLLQNDLVDQAIELLRRVYGAHSAEPTVRFYLASALMDKAEQIPQIQRESHYAVTSEAEIQSMRALLGEAMGLSDDPDVQKDGRQMMEYLTKMEATTWRPPNFFLNVGGLVKWVGASAVVIIIGLFMMGSAAGAGSILLLGGIGVLGLLIATSRVPGWKANARNHGV